MALIGYLAFSPSACRGYIVTVKPDCSLTCDQGDCLIMFVVDCWFMTQHKLCPYAQKRL